VTEDTRGPDDELERRSTSAEPAPLSAIWPLLGRHIAFHRRLVDLTSSVKAALLLSQSIYWTRHGRDIAKTGGWFHKTTEQWAMETGLSGKEQATARELLRNLALIEDRRMGTPARLHFRLSVEELGARLGERIAGQLQVADWSDRMVLAELLGPSVAFHRSLAGIAGGVHAGLMLSRALHLTRLQSRRRMDHWVTSPAARWFDELGLTRREQETARRDLVHVGLWEERLRGIPPILATRIRLDCLLTLLIDDVSMGRKFDRRRINPDHSVAAIKVSPNGETRMWHLHSQVLPKPPIQFRPIRVHSSADSAILLMSNSTGVSVQPQNSGSATNPPIAMGGGELIFPEQMLPDERQAACLLLRHCGDQAQSLLDELAGRLQMRGVRSSPVAYLRGLIARAAAGTFVPELAPRVAAKRVQSQKEAVLRRECEAEEQRLAAERATPEYQAKALVQRQKVTQMLDELRVRLKSGKQP
jgi:hypothetical protein